MLARILAYLIANGLTLVVLAAVIPSQVSYDRNETVVLFAVVLTVLNLLVRPVLQFIALPLTCLTFGLFALVVNAAIFYLGAILIEGIDITYLGAFIGALVAGVLNGTLTNVFEKR